MGKKAKTISINLRLPADLHKKLVEAAVAVSPPNSLNSEILARLFKSFDTAAEAEELEVKVKKTEDYALGRIREVEETAVARMRKLEKQAEEFTQRMEIALAESLELQQLVEAKLR